MNVNTMILVFKYVLTRKLGMNANAIQVLKLVPRITDSVLMLMSVQSHLAVNFVVILWDHICVLVTLAIFCDLTNIPAKQTQVSLFFVCLFLT